MSASYQLHHDAGTSRFKASFPGLAATGDPVEVPRFIKLIDSTRGASAYLQTATRRGASGNQIWVSPQILKQSNDRQVTYESSSSLHYRLYLLFNDPGQRLALVGLIVGLSGWIFGDILPALFPNQASLDTTAKSIATSLKGIGPLLTFIGALKSGGN